MAQPDKQHSWFKLSGPLQEEKCLQCGGGGEIILTGPDPDSGYGHPIVAVRYRCKQCAHEWVIRLETKDDGRGLIATTLRSKFDKAAPFEKYDSWRWKSPRKIAEKCSQCGSKDELWCMYADSGFVDFYDEFYHICLSCGHIDHQSEFGGSIGFEGHAYCPFCRYQWA